MIAKVVFDNREHNIDRFFDYNVPERLEKFIFPGIRVRVPLGKGNKAAYGIVVLVSHKSDFEGLKDILGYTDKNPVCSEKMIKLCMWLKKRCFCSFYQALRLVAPPGMSRGVGHKTKRFVRLLLDEEQTEEYLKAFEKKHAQKLFAATRLLSEKKYISAEEIYKETGADSSVLNNLAKKGIAEITEEVVERNAFSLRGVKATQAYRPTEEQKKVIDFLNGCIEDEKHEKVLLRGVTGSGKTEVFLQAIETVIKKGKNAIMLVPEISLTPQTVNRFVSRFGDYVAVIHSGLSQGERFDEWQKIRDGRVKVVVGARSAVFAPFENIGIIILDEEHENSYKSDSSPRYHAAEVAEKRAKDDNAVLLLASATPTVCHYHSAKSGEYRLFEMKKRYNEMALPTVKVVDMRSELFEHKNRSPISLVLQKEIKKNLETKTKTILFLNRRGYSTFVSCRECGYVAECPECSISLTYHKNEDSLVCHYCGYTRENLTLCPECGSKYVRYFGTGTQRIEEEIKRLFPAANVMRMDFDTTKNKGGHEKVLNEFAKGGDILLGTQMVTKGLDFKDVTLVGILAADTTLCMDDFRAGERSFSLFTQVCGRAGRGDVPGRAVIQTYQPYNSIIKYASSQDYAAFFESEIKARERLYYPPFCRIVCIMAVGDDDAKTFEIIEEIGKILYDFSNTYKGRVDIVKPQAAPISKIKNRFRYRIVLKIDRLCGIEGVLEGIAEKYSSNRGGVYTSIDIDPANMY